MAEVETVVKIANYLQVPAGNIYLNKEKIATRTCASTKETYTGFSTIIKSLVHESSSKIGKNSVITREIEAQVNQWLEYVTLYLAPGSTDKHVSQQLLVDLNQVFLLQSYLVGHTLTLADLAVYYTIYNLMKSLSPQDKEKYLNLSRWFNHIQQVLKIQDANLLKFPTIYLLNSSSVGLHK